MEYRGHIIEKFYSEKFVPRHIIREYYQGEKDRIDRIIRYEEAKKNNENVNTKSVNESLDEFFKEIEG